MVVSIVVFAWWMCCLFAAAGVVQVAAMRNERLKLSRIQWRQEMEARRIQRFKDLQAKFGRKW